MVYSNPKKYNKDYKDIKIGFYYRSNFANDSVEWFKKYLKTIKYQIYILRKFIKFTRKYRKRNIYNRFWIFL